MGALFKGFTALICFLFTVLYYGCFLYIILGHGFFIREYNNQDQACWASQDKGNDLPQLESDSTNHNISLNFVIVNYLGVIVWSLLFICNAFF